VQCGFRLTFQTMAMYRSAAGAMLPFMSREDVDFFVHLEMYLRQENPPLCGRDHLAFRSAYFPVKDVVDGDLCEQYAQVRTGAALLTLLPCTRSYSACTPCCKHDVEVIVLHPVMQNACRKLQHTYQWPTRVHCSCRRRSSAASRRSWTGRPARCSKSWRTSVTSCYEHGDLEHQVRMLLCMCLWHLMAADVSLQLAVDC
jgi:CPSF A subunit region